MKPWLEDTDMRLYVGDALEVLRGLPDGSVDCCVTSPPYWGLRDYGTGEWEGGNAGCDHKTGRNARNDGDRNGEDGFAGSRNLEGHADMGALFYRDVCGKCGARRVDRQLGLEATPDEYVAQMVAVFREVRRVLAPHGTCWVNLGDSYASPIGGNNVGLRTTEYGAGNERGKKVDELEQTRKASSVKKNIPGLKPKDLVGVPWRVAFALQADGWWLRSEIIWAKKNCMPESVTDRPTKAHEQVFLLTKAPRYYYDCEAIREPHTPDGRLKTVHDHATDNSHANYDNVGNGNERWPNSGRNSRSVWHIATQPYPEAHFATFPEELPRRAISAGCPLWVCRVCDRPRERIVDGTRYEPPVVADGVRFVDASRGDKTRKLSGADYNKQVRRETLGWSDCGHQDYRPGVVLDPFAGAGTTLLVARKLGRHSVGIELNPEYAELVARRTRQLSLLTDGSAA